MTRDTVTESDRGARALTLLREFWRLWAMGSTHLLVLPEGAALLRQIQELLAEETPGRALPGEVER